jgi:hypothetical protein
MRKTIGLVGVGSLGGYIASNLQHHADTIYAVDPDIVEKRNLRNSIYTKIDVNQPKVTALKSKISQCRFVPVNADIKDIDLPSVDEMIDCRDVINRNIDTDIKFSIVGRSLRIDCEEVVFDEDRPGKYLIELEREELSQAGRLARDVTMSDGIQYLKENQLATHMPLSTQSVEPGFKCLVKQRENTVLQNHLEIASASCFSSDLNDVRDGNDIKIRQIINPDIKHNYPQTVPFSTAVGFLRDAMLTQHCIYMVNVNDKCIDVYDLREYGGA